MIFQDALKSIRNNLSKALFYWLTFVLTSMFIFLFFNISMSDEIGVTFINSTQNLALTMTVFVIIVCMIIVFFANDFFVKNKAKDLAIRLICGATYSQLASYLLSQTFLLMLLAIPLGIILALVCIPFINLAFASFLSESFAISVHFDAVILTTIILVSVVFWTTYLNLAFAYRNSASSLLNERKMANPLGSLISVKTTISAKIKRTAFLLCAVLPVIYIYFYPEGVMQAAMIGLFGLYGCLKHVLIPYIEKQIRHTKISDPISLASLGFVRTDIQIMKNNIVLFLICTIILSSIVLSENSKPLEMMLSMLSYIVMSVLLSLAMMFQYSTEISNRKALYQSLYQIGYNRTKLKNIMTREVMMLYAIICLMSLFYLGNMFLTLILHGQMETGFALLLLAFVIIPLLLCALFSLYHYKRTIRL